MNSELDKIIESAEACVRIGDATDLEAAMLSEIKELLEQIEELSQAARQQQEESRRVSEYISGLQAERDRLRQRAEKAEALARINSDVVDMAEQAEADCAELRNDVALMQETILLQKEEIGTLTRTAMRLSERAEKAETDDKAVIYEAGRQSGIREAIACYLRQGDEEDLRDLLLPTDKE